MIAPKVLEQYDATPLQVGAMRVIVSGSRRMREARPILEAFAAVLAPYDGDYGEPTPRFVIVHGAGPGSKGAPGCDALADAVFTRGIYKDLVATVERHPAELFGEWPGCGPRRNRHMAQLGASLCLAFPARVQRGRDGAGTRGMIELCFEHGIPVNAVPIDV